MNEEIDFAAFGLRPVARQQQQQQHPSQLQQAPSYSVSPSAGSRSDTTSPPQQQCQMSKEYELGDDNGSPLFTGIGGASGLFHQHPASSSSTSSIAVDAATPPPVSTLSVALPGRGSISLPSQASSKSTLFWAFDITGTSVERLYQQSTFRLAMAAVRRRMTEQNVAIGRGATAVSCLSFSLLSAPHCSIPFARNITDRHLAVFEHAEVRLIPRELLLFGDASTNTVEHLVLIFDCDDGSVAHLLNDNVPLFALLGSSGNTLHSFKACKAAVLQLAERRRKETKSTDPLPYGTQLLEKGVVSWRFAKFSVVSTLSKHVKGDGS
jgi:hypothetical protein